MSKASTYGSARARTDKSSAGSATRVGVIAVIALFLVAVATHFSKAGVSVALDAAGKYSAKEKADLLDGAIDGLVDGLAQSPGADTEKSQNLKAIAKEMSISGMLDTGGGALNKIEIIQKEWKGAKTFPSQTSIVLKKALGQGLGIPIFLEALEATVAGNRTAVDIKAVVAPSPEMDGFVKESRFRVLDGHHRWAAGLLILGDAFMLKGYAMKGFPAIEKDDQLVSAGALKGKVDKARAARMAKKADEANEQLNDADRGMELLDAKSCMRVLNVLSKSMGRSGNLGNPPSKCTNAEADGSHQDCAIKKDFAAAKVHELFDCIKDEATDPAKRGETTTCGTFGREGAPHVTLAKMEQMGKILKADCTTSTAFDASRFGEGTCFAIARAKVAGNAALIVKNSPPTQKLPVWAGLRHNMPVITENDLKDGSAFKTALLAGKVDWHGPYAAVGSGEGDDKLKSGAPSAAALLVKDNVPEEVDWRDGVSQPGGTTPYGCDGEHCKGIEGHPKKFTAGGAAYQEKRGGAAATAVITHGEDEEGAGNKGGAATATITHGEDAGADEGSGPGAGPGSDEGSGPGAGPGSVVEPGTTTDTATPPVGPVPIR